MVGTLQDSQNLLQLQRESEQKLRLTIESVAEGIMTTDLEGHIIDINDANLRLHGCIEKKRNDWQKHIRFNGRRMPWKISRILGKDFANRQNQQR